MPRPDARHGWLALCAVLALFSVVLFWWPSPVALVWSASMWTQQPWTLWTAAWLHLSLPHLLGNLLVLAALTWLGHLLDAGWRALAVVLLAWPLGTGALVFWSEVQDYRGLSGLLHAMVVLLGLQALRVRRHLHLGFLLLAGLLLKLGWEQGWSHPLVWDAGWGFNVVRAAHLSGSVAALLVAALISSRRPGSS